MSVPTQDSNASSLKLVHVSATILRVLEDGLDGRAWRAYVQSQNARAFIVRFESCPAGISAGDDLHFAGRRYSSGDSLFPDEIRLSKDDADGRLGTALASGLVSFEPSISQVVPTNIDEVAASLGLETLAGARHERMAHLVVPSPGVVGVVRSRDSADPAVSWAMERFSDKDTVYHRGPVIVMMDPMALGAREITPRGLGIIQRIAYASSSVFQKSNQKPTTFLSGVLKGPNPEFFSAALPAPLSSRERQILADDTLSPVPTARLLASGDPGIYTGSHIIIPYDPTTTGISLFSGLSFTKPSNGFMPKAVVGPRARAMLSTAHEMAHAHIGDYGFPYNELDEKNASECFADSVAILTYVLDTGDTQNALIWSQTRSISALFGISGLTSHVTGPACMAALKEAEIIRREHGDGQVPLSIILSAAKRITLAESHPDPEDLSQVVAKMHEINSDWASLAHEDMMKLHDSARIELPESKITKEATRKFVDCASYVFHEIVYAPKYLLKQDVRTKAIDVEINDWKSSFQYLRDIGLGNLIPSVLNKMEISLENTNITKRKNQRSVKAIAKTLPRFSEYALAPLFSTIPPSEITTMRVAAAALMDLSTAVVSLFQRDNLADALAKERSSAMRWAMASYVVHGVGNVKAASPVATVISPRSDEETAFTSLDLSTRFRLLGEAAAEKVRILKYQDVTETEVSYISEIIRRLAWSIRVDQESWANIQKHYRGIDLGAITFAALPPSERPIAMMWKDLKIAELSFLRIRTVAQQESAAHDIDSHLAWLKGENLDGCLDWSGRDLRWLELKGHTFSGAVLTDANLGSMDLSECDFSSAQMQGSNLEDTVIDRASFKAADLTGAVMSGVTGIRVNMVGTVLVDAVADRAVIMNSDLRRSQLAGASFKSAKLSNSVFSSAYDADIADFSEADLNGCIGLHTPHHAIEPIVRRNDLDAVSMVYCEDDFRGRRP